jgi:hypothetical protein
LNFHVEPRVLAWPPMHASEDVTMPYRNHAGNDPLNPFGIGRSADAGQDAEPAQWTDEAGNCHCIETDPELGELQVIDRPQPPASDDDPFGGPAQPAEPQDGAATGDAPFEAAPATGPPDVLQTSRIALADGNQLEGALWYAANGYAVFPLEPGTKTPFKDAVRDGRAERHATTDAAAIRAWWAREPRANIGVVGLSTGCVLDIDARKGGYETLAKLEAEYGALPATAMAVATPGGGEHLYFRASPAVAPSADRVGRAFGHEAHGGRIVTGLDTRGASGYVVGAGSYYADHDGAKGYKGFYRLTSGAPAFQCPEAPHWLIEQAGSQRERSDAPPACEPDLAENVAFAVSYLQHDAPVAIQGSGGNKTTYAVAARLHELGVSPETAAELMAAHWNERCVPPWSSDELAAICRNAANYAQEAFGARAATVTAEGFGVAMPLDPPALTGAPLFRMQSLRERRANLETPQGVEWVYGQLYARKLLTVTVAAGGVGKSTLTVAETLAIATGRPLLGVEVHRKSRVAYYNLEDGIDTTDRAFKAALQHYGLLLDNPDVLDNIAVMSGRDAPVKIASMDRGAIKIAAPLIEAMVAWLKANDVKVLTVDPFVDSHGVPESDNTPINDVAKAWGQVAERADCAVHLVHHVRKLNGKKIEAEDARGAVALIAAARVVRTLAHVTDPSDMEKLGIDKAAARDHFMSEDGGKRNVGRASGKVFFRRASVSIAVRRESGIGYDAAPVAVAAKVKPASVKVELSSEQVDAIAAEIGRRPAWRAERGTPGNRVTWPIMKALRIDPLLHDSEDKADAALKTLARRGIVKHLPFTYPYSQGGSRSGKKCPCYTLEPRSKWDGAADWNDATSIKAEETDDEDA